MIFCRLDFEIRGGGQFGRGAREWGAIREKKKGEHVVHRWGRFLEKPAKSGGGGGIGEEPDGIPRVKKKNKKSKHI